MTEPTFEQSLNRLEEIVRDLERNELDLEQALRLFEEGILHLRTAGAAHKTVDARVQQHVEAADGSFSLVEFGS